MLQFKRSLVFVVPTSNHLMSYQATEYANSPSNKLYGSYISFVGSFGLFSFTFLFDRLRRPPDPLTIPHRVALAPAPSKVFPPKRVVAVSLVPPSTLCLAIRKTPACLRAHIGFCKCVARFKTAEQLIVYRSAESG